MKKEDCKLIRLTDLRRITAPELRAHIASLQKEGIAFECATVEVIGGTTTAQLLFVPRERRGGVAWGRATRWGTVGSMAGLYKKFWKTSGWMWEGENWDRDPKTGLFTWKGKEEEDA